VDYVRARLAESQVPPTLRSALGRRRAAEVGAELAVIVGELYETVARNRRGIKLIDRSARDRPDLAALWFEGARGGLIRQLTAYFRARRTRLRLPPDPAVAARLVIETVVFWAVHRHWDPHPQRVDEAVAREFVVSFLVRGLVKE
jgi:hypothetical protein